jgi:hypothetical protein
MSITVSSGSRGCTVTGVGSMKREKSSVVLDESKEKVGAGEEGVMGARDAIEVGGAK